MHFYYAIRNTRIKIPATTGCMGYNGRRIPIHRSIWYIVRRLSLLLHTNKYVHTDWVQFLECTKWNVPYAFYSKLKYYDPRKSSWASTNLQLQKFSALIMPFCLFTFQNSRSNACKLNSIVSRFIRNLYFVIRMLHDEWITNTASLLIFILLFFPV